jgi:dicarboxylate/amino acid:cation (Na+ or H+) symporter, DAACS family
MKLWAKSIIAITGGALTGIILGPSASVLKPVGTLFLNLLNLLIVPLVFSSMIMGVTSTPDTKRLGRVGGITLLMYAATTLVAIVLGMAVANWLHLGQDLHFTAQSVQTVKELPSFADLLLSFVPKNPIAPFVEGNIVQVILLSVAFCLALNKIGVQAKPIIDIVEALSSVMFKLTSFVMMLSPFGVFALMAWATGSFGLDLLVPVFKFLLSYYLAALIFTLVVFCGILVFMARLSPLPFFKGMLGAIVTAASTCSSSASLPCNIQCIEKLGISKSLANFVLPLGCSLNMNGSALFQGMAALFIAECYGIELQLQHMFIIAATVILATIGTASIPGAGLIMLSIVFSSVGIPLEGIALLASVDRLRDMATTALNITGDAVCAVYVAKQEGELDETKYYEESTKREPQHVEASTQ